jgi:hypothetical protein
MMDRNASSLFAVYRRAEELFDKLLSLTDQFQDWVCLGSANLENFVEENLHEVEDWQINFEIIKEREKEVR